MLNIPNGSPGLSIDTNANTVFPDRFDLKAKLLSQRCVLTCSLDLALPVK